jgi:hypothetical protein
VDGNPETSNPAEIENHVVEPAVAQDEITVVEEGEHAETRPVRRVPRWVRWVGHKKRVRPVPKIVMKYVLLAKVRFPPPRKRSPDNVQAFSDFVRRNMEKDGVRLSDQYKYINRIVHQIFIPNKHELEAIALQHSSEAKSNTRVFDWLGGNQQH